MATVKGRKRNENTFLMFGNREKKNRKEMERRMYAFTFMPTNEFERGGVKVMGKNVIFCT